ncbi:MAG: 2Fe-2S iron-sulfur cluster binding domain-containing protein [Spongiibacteraceae bacterium]|nr:2Fe-2S iron-sulfur cluster binding domain-containing protein [Spongiibacteraceae bacterium]
MGDLIDDPDDQPFKVKIASSGETYTIAPGESVSDVLADHGLEIPTSCCYGLCGSCVTGVLEGTPDHRDHYLTTEEQQSNKRFTPCCSRSKSPLLVLDL